MQFGRIFFQGRVYLTPKHLQGSQIQIALSSIALSLRIEVHIVSGRRGEKPQIYSSPQEDPRILNPPQNHSRPKKTKLFLGQNNKSLNPIVTSDYFNNSNKTNRLAPQLTLLIAISVFVPQSIEKYQLGA